MAKECWHAKEGKAGKVRQVDGQTSGSGKQHTDATPASGGSQQQQSGQGAVRRFVFDLSDVAPSSTACKNGA